MFFYRYFYSDPENPGTVDNRDQYEHEHEGLKKRHITVDFGNVTRHFSFDGGFSVEHAIKTAQPTPLDESTVHKPGNLFITERGGNIVEIGVVLHPCLDKLFRYMMEQKLRMWEWCNALCESTNLATAMCNVSLDGAACDSMDVSSD